MDGLHDQPSLETPQQTTIILQSHNNREMSLSRVHSLGDVPFSWENSPGICKEFPKGVGVKGVVAPDILSLPPPPCPTDCPKVVGHHDLQVPLPPCPFQPPLRSSSKKWQREDPFLAAYKECTKSGVRDGKVVSKEVKKVRCMSLFSCKHSCKVRDDGLVRVAHRSTSSNSTSTESSRR